MSADKTVQLAINTIRSLAIDAIQKANSGHPGTPLDAAPTAYAPLQLFLRYDPDHPNWLGAAWNGMGVNFALFSENGAKVEE
jgi:transketolase